MVHDSLVTICDENESEIRNHRDVRDSVSPDKIISHDLERKAYYLSRSRVLTSRSLTLYLSTKETMQARSSVLLTNDEHKASNCGDLALSSLMSSGRTGLPLPKKNSGGAFKMLRIGAITLAELAMLEPLCGVPKKKMA